MILLSIYYGVWLYRFYTTVSDSKFKQHNIFDLTNTSNHDHQYTGIISITVIIRLNIIVIIKLSNIYVLSRLFMLLT